MKYITPVMLFIAGTICWHFPVTEPAAIAMLVGAALTFKDVVDSAGATSAAAPREV